MRTIKIDNLIRSKRKTLHLKVSTDAKLTVRVPFNCSDEIIRKFVQKHADWIIHRQNYAQEHCKPASPKQFVSGEEFLYIGKHYKLVISEVNDAPLTFDGLNFVLVANYLNNPRELFIRWYKQEAFKMISERVRLYSSITGIRYHKTSITDAHHRWGSCSAKGNLNFTWSLIMAPLEVIDCVIVHELVHIKIKGHSKHFWQKVREFVPKADYCRVWLNENQNLLAL